MRFIGVTLPRVLGAAAMGGKTTRHGPNGFRYAEYAPSSIARVDERRLRFAAVVARAFLNHAWRRCPGQRGRLRRRGSGDRSADRTLSAPIPTMSGAAAARPGPSDRMEASLVEAGLMPALGAALTAKRRYFRGAPATTPAKLHRLDRGCRNAKRAALGAAHSILSPRGLPITSKSST